MNDLDSIRLLLAKTAVPHMELAAKGKIVDKDDRVICTFNLKDLTLVEAYTFARLFTIAAQIVESSAEETLATEFVKYLYGSVDREMIERVMKEHLTPPLPISRNKEGKKI